MSSLVQHRLIPVGEDAWIQEGPDGDRPLQQTLQLDVEVHIRIHKVSLRFACGQIGA